MTENYISFHNHTTYSILDALPSPEDYLKKCKEFGMNSFGITEHGNNFSWLYFAELSKKYNIKINYGVDFYECFDHKERDKNSKYFHLICYAKNENGRIAINKLISKSNSEGFYFKPRVDLDMIKEFGNDLIGISACLGSKIAREKNYEKCLEYVNEYKSTFGDFFLEMQSHESDEQSEYNKKILNLSIDTNTKYIITTDSHFINKNDQKFHSKFVEIARDIETSEEIYSGCYFQDTKEIHDIMDKQIGFENVELGLKNTFFLDSLIEEVAQPFQDSKLPNFCKNEEDKLMEEIKNGIVEIK